MRVSVLVPIYGVEQYMEQCAVTLLEQTYEDVEYIFVDDCSPDGSVGVLRQVLDRYPGRRAQVRIIRHDRNRGLGAARKTALEAATGEFVFVADSDDYVEPDAVRLLAECQQQTGADIVTGVAMAHAPASPAGTPLPLPPTDRTLAVRMLLMQNTLTHSLWARLIRRSLFTEHGISPEEGINQAEDYAVTPRLFLAARTLANVGAVVYHYRMAASSTFTDQVSPRHAESFLRANGAVASYLLCHDSGRRFLFSLETGMLNTYYNALKAGCGKADVVRHCRYVPQGWFFRLCHLLVVHRPLLPLLRLSYLSVKWCYKRRLGLRS